MSQYTEFVYSIVYTFKHDVRNIYQNDLCNVMTFRTNEKCTSTCAGRTTQYVGQQVIFTSPMQDGNIEFLQLKAPMQKLLVVVCHPL